MKTDTVFKRAFNDALDLVADLGEGAPLPSENAFKAELEVSRTTVRKVIAALAERHLVTGSETHRIVRSGKAGRAKRFPEAETVPLADVGREAFHGVDAARQRASGHRDQRT